MIFNHLNEGGEGSGNFDHAGRPGQVGGSSKPYKSPTMRPPLYNSTGKRNLERSKERAQAMSNRFPGVKFSLFNGHPLGVAEGKKLGIPGMGEPQACFDFRIGEGNEDLIDSIIAANKKWANPGTGYTTLNAIKIETGFDYQDIFRAINAYRKKNPRNVMFSVNRLNDPVYVRFINAKK